ncbi:hypothetical protein BDR05DRAFT_203844 [Suillus weaverae]|nr:hypothetical protein BDR05DRAFT_203844 [Suillus weaverae]
MHLRNRDMRVQSVHHSQRMHRLAIHGNCPAATKVECCAIEGKAKQGQDGIAIRMYLKLSIPMDFLLVLRYHYFLGNLKMLRSEVHPTDSNSAPQPLQHCTRSQSTSSLSKILSLCFWSTNVQRLCHESRLSCILFYIDISHCIPASGRRVYSSHPCQRVQHSYVLPKQFPPRLGVDSAIRVSTFSAAKMRRGSVGERNNIHFMAGLDLWVPYVCRPPKAPFLTSIPLPHCLSNNVRIRMFPPSSTTTSSSSAYTDRGSGGIAILGAFPSADRLRVRWAAPMRTMHSKDGRRHVEVKEAKGEMTCHVLGKDSDPSSGREGILMKPEYTGTAKGVWFPGVATMLGMDVGLEARGFDVILAPAEETTWTVTGGAGYTGFDVNPRRYRFRGKPR